MQQVVPYSVLARSYDHILRHVDYQSWYEYIVEVMHRYFGSPSLILELGCGTGRFGAKFARDNYTIIGIDRSLDMLHVAKARTFKKFSIFCADIRNFYLSTPADFIFSVHDTMNYLSRPSDVAKALLNLKDAMHERSIFMFDVTTEYNINRYFDGKMTNYEVRGTDVSWTNSFDRKRRIVSSVMTFTKDGKKVFVERHIQRIYSIGDIKKILAKTGFEILDIFGDSTFQEPCGESVMINFIVRKK
ncbi:MAG TPA: class I SAM-dependent methyltransferase [Spirochaetota bacterium]|nr:class I SAM-dependent methyltransferase [Spirochaetota bacterium]HPI90426.1 class I SAM-dependent methyltransferase [Spirochaetota bacterium]HPR46552.1 class I SAM-dependent methyltransferase [Spirochaetota bacterium]